MSKVSIYDRASKALFADKGSVSLTDKEELVRKRLLTAYVKKVNDPLVQDKELVKLLVNTYEICESQAYLDISHVERIFGDFRKANKDWIRHMITETQKRAITFEQKRLSENPKLSTKSLSYAALVLAKANGLDKVDPNLPDWDAIQPPMIEASDDVTILDLANIEDDTVAKLRAKYVTKRKEIQDAEVIDPT